MKGENDYKRFSVLLFWLAKRMKSSNGIIEDIDTDLINDYYEALEDIVIERLEWASRHIFKTEVWFPEPVKLRQAALLAPSSVMPPLPELPCNQGQIAEFTEQEIERSKRYFNDIINGVVQHVSI